MAQVFCGQVLKLVVSDTLLQVLAPLAIVGRQGSGLAMRCQRAALRMSLRFFRCSAGGCAALCFCSARSVGSSSCRRATSRPLPRSDPAPRHSESVCVSTWVPTARWKNLNRALQDLHRLICLLQSATPTFQPKVGLELARIR